MELTQEKDPHSEGFISFFKKKVIYIIYFLASWSSANRDCPACPSPSSLRGTLKHQVYTRVGTFSLIEAREGNLIDEQLPQLGYSFMDSLCSSCW